VSEKEDFKDVMSEDMTRGRRQPKKAVTLARERMIRKVADLLADPYCDKRTFLGVIRDYGIKRGIARVSSALRGVGRSPRSALSAVRSAFRIRLSCSSGGSVERWRDTIFVKRRENSRALIRLRLLGITYFHAPVLS